MAFNDDDWLHYSLDELTKPDSIPPNNFFDQSIDNIPLNDEGASPARDHLDFNTDLAVPLGDYQFGNDPTTAGRLSPQNHANTSFQNMHLMQNAGNFDNSMQGGGNMNVDYNTFEMPTVVPNENQMNHDPFADPFVDQMDHQNNTFYAEQQPSTSHQMMGGPPGGNGGDMQQMQMINMDDQYQPQVQVQQQQQQQQQQVQMMHQEPSTSYAHDQHLQQSLNDPGMMMNQQQQPMQHQQQQHQMQDMQQQQQQQMMQPKPAPKKSKPNNRKKPPANTVGAMLTKVNKMSQPIDTSGSRMEAALSQEESARVGQLMNEIARLKGEEATMGIDHSATLNALQAEFSSIFAKNLSSSATSVNTEIISQIQSLTGAQQQQQQQQQQQPVQQKKPPPKRNRNQQQQNGVKIGPPKLMMESPQTSMMGPPSVGNQYVDENYHNQMVYQPGQQQQQQQIHHHQQQDMMQQMPSTSSAQEYSDYQPQIDIQDQHQKTKVPSMNSRTHVYRQQAVIYQNSNQQLEPIQDQQQQQQQFQNQQVYVQQQPQQQQQQMVMQSPVEQNSQQIMLDLEGMPGAPATLGDVVRQQQHQIRFQNQPTTTTTKLQRGANQRRISNMSLQSSQANSPLMGQQPQQMQQQMPTSPPEAQTILITRENAHHFPNVPIGSIVQIINQPQQPQQQFQDQQHQQMQMQQQHHQMQMHQHPMEMSNQQSPDTPQTSGMMEGMDHHHQMMMGDTMEDLGDLDGLLEEENDDDEEREIEIEPLNEEQVADQMNQAAGERHQRLRNYFDAQLEKIENADTDTEFKDLKDVYERLIPYHIFMKPEISKEAVDDFDDNWIRYNVGIDEAKKSLEEKIRHVCLKETYKNSDQSELMLLQYLDTEYERQQLEKDKQAAAENLDEFVATSKIVQAMRDPTSDVIVDSAGPMPPSPLMIETQCEEDPIDGLYNEHVYNEFDETPKEPPSPYFSPVYTERSRYSSLAASSDDEEEEELDLAPPVLRPETMDTPPPMLVKQQPQEQSEDEEEDEDDEEDVLTPKLKAIPNGSVRLPTKKQFLTRARKDVPVALRSPAKPPSFSKNNMSTSSSTAETLEDSDGSASPELGSDDVDMSSSHQTFAAGNRLRLPKIEVEEEADRPRLPVIRVPIAALKQYQPQPEVKVEIVENGEAQAPIRLKIKLPPKVVVAKIEKPETPEPMPVLTPISAPSSPKPERKRKATEVKQQQQKKRKSKDGVAVPVKVTPKEKKKKINGKMDDGRIVQVMTEDRRFVLKMRAVPKELSHMVTPRRVAKVQRDLTPTLSTKLRMKIRRSDVGVVQVKCSEKSSAPVVKPVTAPNGSTKAYVKRTMGTAERMKLKRSKMMENNGASTSASTPPLKKAAFTNRFNPFASNPPKPPVERKPTALMNLTPAVPAKVVEEEKKPMLTLTAPTVVEASTRMVSPRPPKLSSLLPWMDDTPEKQPTERKKKAEAVTTPKPNVQPAILTPKEDELDLQQNSPRASSSLSLSALFEDDKSNAVLSFLASPPRTEPLPAVDFSDDDEEDDLMRSDFSRAAERIIALSSSQTIPQWGGNGTAPQFQ